MQFLKCQIHCSTEQSRFCVTYHRYIFYIIVSVDIPETTCFRSSWWLLEAIITTRLLAALESRGPSSLISFAFRIIISKRWRAHGEGDDFIHYRTPLIMSCTTAAGACVTRRAAVKAQCTQYVFLLSRGAVDIKALYTRVLHFPSTTPSLPQLLCLHPCKLR